MANSLLTNSIITKKCLAQLKNKLSFTKNVNKEYSSEFAQKGAKVGNTINIRKPDRYEVTSGAALVIQDSVNRSIPLVLDQHKHVGMAFSEVDRTLSLDKFTELFIDPAVSAIANAVDAACLAAAYKKIYNCVGVPSATVYPSTLKGFTQAKAKIAMGGGNIDALTALVNPDVEASLVEGLKGLFQSSEQIKKQYEDGIMGYAAGSKFMMSQNMPMHTIGNTVGTPLTNYPSAYVAGSTTLATDGWTNDTTGVLKAGDVITIAGVYAVNPQTRQSTGALAQFVVQADVNSGASTGPANITLDRGMYASGKMQNVDALPADGAAIKTFGEVTSLKLIQHPQSLVFHKSAFALGCADFELPDAGVKASRAVDPESGLSLSMCSQCDIVNYRTIHRLDFLFGFETVYADMAARVVGQPA